METQNLQPLSISVHPRERYWGVKARSMASRPEPEF
jgi:hypothetical protein